MASFTQPASWRGGDGVTPLLWFDESGGFTLILALSDRTRLVSLERLARMRRKVRRGREKWRWPKPLWRLRGFAELPVGGHRFRFCEAGRSPQHGWAGRVHRRTWEPEVIECFSKALRPGDVVFDVGAYVGPYTLLASRVVGPSGHVYAFEPDPVARSLLERNVGVNQALNVSVLPYAVGACDGWGSLAYGVLGDSATRITAADDAGSTGVAIVSLRTFCRQRNVRPDVIKIDVEGGEVDVLVRPALDDVAGARCVFVELHERELQARGSSGDLLVDLLVSQGGDLIEIADRAQGSRNIAVVFGRRATLTPGAPDASCA